MKRKKDLGEERFAVGTVGSAAPVPIPINFNKVEIGAALITRPCSILGIRTAAFDRLHSRPSTRRRGTELEGLRELPLTNLSSSSAAKRASEASLAGASRAIGRHAAFASFIRSDSLAPSVLFNPGSFSVLRRLSSASGNRDQNPRPG